MDGSMPASFTLCTDGGARGNPGPAAIGVVIVDQDGAIVQQYKAFIGTATNNQAEYHALLKGMSLAAIYWKGELNCLSDSELLIKQLNGQYRVKNDELRALFFQVKKAEAPFRHVSYAHVPRTHDLSVIADRLVNEALDEQGV
jgi:ribonuclease HI